MFPCTSCGCCCKRIDKAVSNLGILNSDNDLHFPYTWDESGQCENLTENNLCRIYENRPTICNIEKLLSLVNIEKEIFYRLNANACNRMMDEDGVDESFRVNIK